MAVNFISTADSGPALQGWLSDSPFEWSSALATRTAIRCLPWMLSESVEPDWLDRYALPTFHSLFIAWSTHTHPVKGHKLAAELSANLLRPAALSPHKEAFFASGVRAIALAIAANRKIDKAQHSTRAIAAFENLTKNNQISNISEELFNTEINLDITKFEKIKQSNEYVRRFLSEPAVSLKSYSLWIENLSNGMDRLIAINSTFDVWKPWIMQIAAGTFAKRNDHKRDSISNDRQLAVRIIQSLDANFWERSALVINNDLRSWNADPAAQEDIESLHRPLIPPQNDNVISFHANEIGKIDISPKTNYESVRNDQDTLDRFSECLINATDVLNSCKGSNSATRLIVVIERYLEALGPNIENIRPSLLVQRGERLRQELAACQAVDSMLPPVPDGIILDLKAWQSSHNLLVGLDPALMARDTAQLGPDLRSADVPPEEIRELANDAEENGLLADNVVEIVVEAANLAPDTPNPLNRKTIWSFETGRNLVIEAFNLALSNPGKTLAGTVVTGISLSTVGVGGSVAGAVVGAYPAAMFLLKHRSWIESRLGDMPTWRGLFVSLCDWLKDNTPPR